MFKGVLFGLLVLLGLSTPANAQLVTLNINGTVTGSQTTVVCNSGSAPDCLTLNPGGTISEQFLRAFNFSINATSFVEGNNPFSTGDARIDGLWSGIVNNSGGFLTGQNISFIRESSSCRFGAIGCQYVTAGASTFNVVGNIPEPGTWATMLLGFFAVGMAMRKKAVRLHAVAELKAD